MRVRFGGQALGAARPGMSRLAAALGGGDRIEQQAFDQASVGQSRIAQALAAINRDEAQADETRAKIEILARRPGIYEEQAALLSGVDVPNVQAFRQQVQTGQDGQVPMGPEAPDGSMGVGSAQFTPEQRSKLATALSRLAPVLMNGGDIKVDDWQKAQSGYRDMDLGDRVIAGSLPAAAVGRSQAAVGGKPLYGASATGAVLDLFGGALDTSNPMARSEIALRGEQAGAQRANAAQSYAAADNSRASAAKTRAEMAEGQGKGGKAPVGYRWNGETLEPIPGGPADPNTKGAKLNKPPTESQAKALMFGSRMQIADEILGELASAGTDQPGRVKQAVETVPMVGGALGMGVNSLPPALGGPSDAQQQVEQAQRDFINAVLRRESGAVIADGEFRNAQRQYFPQPGDSAAVKRQKAANRRAAIGGMQAEFGEASMPQFRGIVEEARAARRAAKPQAKPREGGATGDWGDGWKIERVD